MGGFFIDNSLFLGTLIQNIEGNTKFSPPPRYRNVRLTVSILFSISGVKLHKIPISLQRGLNGSHQSVYTSLFTLDLLN